MFVFHQHALNNIAVGPVSYTHLDVYKRQVLEEEYEGICGQAVKVGKDFLYVKTGKGTLSIKELQLQGKKRLGIDAF